MSRVGNFIEDFAPVLLILLFIFALIGAALFSEATIARVAEVCIESGAEWIDNSCVRR